MAATTVSPKFQVVIPKEIRELTGIQAGERLSVYEEDGVIKMVRIPPLKQLRGIAKGLPPFERERDPRP
ncbi:MAG: AbrB/MazE/SpoVT family DNA-binding domain-containing protein [Acidobacteria bacterium]|nr:AbrB/MazE/SpoVT family DNA-binding domain-containing protein [Acidobacteriota bacterium]MCX6595860.1 AbrB/MazE/SpoVT family DNA-binding domain-containing protein [Acidobacteriota bacterium]